MKRLLPVFCCVVFLFSGACSPTKKRVFPNSDRIFAMEMVRKQCEIVPRHSGSAGAERTADLILKTARSMPGITAETDSFEEDTPSGKIVFRNVIAKLPGKGKGKPVILGAHYDAKKLESSSAFHAANDGGSGVAVLLSVMKILSTQKEPLPFPVHFIFFDGEECQINYGSNDGLHGSKKAARDYKGKARAMILADMVGDKDWKISIPENSSPELKKIAEKSAAELNLQNAVICGNMQVLDDHVPFLEAGIPALDLIDFEYGPDNVYWHTVYDTIEQIDPESLGKCADLILKMLAIMEME